MEGLNQKLQFMLNVDQGGKPVTAEIFTVLSEDCKHFMGISMFNVGAVRHWLLNFTEKVRHLYITV